MTGSIKQNYEEIIQDACQQEEYNVSSYVSPTTYEDGNVQPLLRNYFTTQKEVGVVNLVKKALGNMREEQIDSFINDDDNEDYEDDDEEEDIISFSYNGTLCIGSRLEKEPKVPTKMIWLEEILMTTSAISKPRGKGQRGKYKCMVVDVKNKGGKSKRKVYMPDDILQSIDDNAQQLVNCCGYIARTMAPVNVQNWEETFSIAGERMWTELKDTTRCMSRLQCFVIKTMQRLYKLWKSRLHTHYKQCGTTRDERLKIHRMICEWINGCTTKEKNNVKPTVDMIWLAD
ncbi:hypothetical protein Cgig2_004635 [Carnegiea gigantea]|uniref:Uncharacterized protein n=1 Tax=Carnegiea gigantea TaxID=171969 RepID=A0A9Q1QAP1_9CARY|nr:hypothetical protein Cgig2_004635 [Carnegiea gigantea]